MTVLHRDRPAGRFHVAFVDRSRPAKQTPLADRGDLIRHDLLVLAIEDDRGFRRIKPVNPARCRNDLHAVQQRIRGVIADHGGGTGLPDLAPDKRDRQTPAKPHPRAETAQPPRRCVSSATSAITPSDHAPASASRDSSAAMPA